MSKQHKDTVPKKKKRKNYQNCEPVLGSNATGKGHTTGQKKGESSGRHIAEKGGR